MTSQILQTFSSKAEKNEAVFVSFITAGYPTIADTVPVMLALQQGGADIIELGIPFSDPQADGPAIQASNNVSFSRGQVNSCLEGLTLHCSATGRTCSKSRRTDVPLLCEASTRAGIDDSCAVDGILQPHAGIWRRKDH